jgi:hypothetical protein
MVQWFELLCFVCGEVCDMVFQQTAAGMGETNFK